LSELYADKLPDQYQLTSSVRYIAKN